MYNLLVVDDEIFVTMGITQGIDWESAGFDRVFAANSADEARNIMLQQDIDIVIFDIEMPGTSGLELGQWVIHHFSEMEIVYLTGHANFSYAQQAIKLGSSDYLLKPVDHADLKHTVICALDRVRNAKESKHFNAMYHKYMQMWEAQRPLLLEKMWQDILSRKETATLSRLQSLFSLYQTPLHEESRIVPILISIEEWQKELSFRDNEVMELALRNAAAELFLNDRDGDIIRDKSGGVLILLFDPDVSILAQEEWRNCCYQFIQACSEYFYCIVSCYIGGETKITEIHEMYERLLHMEGSNPTISRAVMKLGEQGFSAGPHEGTLPLGDWQVLLDMNKEEELLERFDHWFDRLHTSPPSPETLQMFYYGLLYALYGSVQKKGYSIREAFHSSDILELKKATKSLTQLHRWAKKMISKCTRLQFKEINSAQSHHSGLIDKIVNYTREHMHENFTREDLAAHVHLNSAYLSRLFRKETGQTLSDFVQKLRIERAKELLSYSDHKIGAIVEAVGYSHASHFTKIFKEVVGLTPAEYRKSFSV